LFQDDWLEPECVAQMMAIAARPLVFCRREFVFETDNPGTIAGYTRHMTDLSIDGVFGSGTDIEPERVRDAVLRHSPLNIFGEPTSCMLHRGVFERFGTYDPRLIQPCDVEFVARVGTHSGISYQPATLARFRVHNGSATAANERRGSFRRDVVEQLLIEHMQASEAPYALLRKAAQRQGIDLEARSCQNLLHQQMWGLHWHPHDWASVIREFPFLRLSPLWRFKRAVRRLAHTASPAVRS